MICSYRKITLAAGEPRRAPWENRVRAHVPVLHAPLPTFLSCARIGPRAAGRHGRFILVRKFLGWLETRLAQITFSYL